MGKRPLTRSIAMADQRADVDASGSNTNQEREEVGNLVPASSGAGSGIQEPEELEDQSGTPDAAGSKVRMSPCLAYCDRVQGPRGSRRPCLRYPSSVGRIGIRPEAAVAISDSREFPPPPMKGLPLLLWGGTRIIFF